MNRSITRGQEPGLHKRRLHKPDPTMFIKVKRGNREKTEPSEQKIL
jgi:hypothetical protein